MKFSSQIEVILYVNVHKHLEVVFNSIKYKIILVTANLCNSNFNNGVFMANFETWCKEVNKEYLLKEWDYERNTILPSEISDGSNKSVFWRCRNDHTWENTIYSRRTTGCPFCANRRVWKGFNDLATLYPDIAKEWDYSKNGELTPDDVVGGSGKRVWWICDKGHSFATSISNRTSQGTGCAVCSGKRVLKGYNDLKTINPWFLQEWDYEKNKDILPDEVSEYSRIKIWWKCKTCGNSWMVAVATRSQGKGCSICSTKKAQAKRYDTLLSQSDSLAEKHPELLKEWDYEKNSKLGIYPDKVLSGSNSEVWWKCEKCNNHWKTMINNRSKGVGCPVCAIEKAKEKMHITLIEKKGSLGDSGSPLLNDWDYEKNIDITPFDVLEGSSIKVWWRCKQCGHSWQNTVGARKGKGCPRCAKELRSSFPEQAIFYYIKELFPDAQNGYRELGYELDIYIPSRKIGIEYDGGAWHKQIIKDEKKNQQCRDNGVFLYRVREEKCPNMNNSANVFCYKYKACRNYEMLNNIIEDLCYRISGNHIDVNIKRDNTNILNLFVVGKKNNNLALLYPEISKEWDFEKNKGITPSMIMPKTNRKYWWKCDQNHIYEASPSNRIGKGQGCPYCAGQKVLSGYNDLKTINPEVAAEWNYGKNNLLPEEIVAGTNKVFWWICKNGHEWKAQVNVRLRGTNCPFCSGRYTIEGENDITITHPQLVEEWDFEKNEFPPQHYKAGSNKKVWWKCNKCGNGWESLICSRTKERGSGCPYCSNSIILSGVNDLATISPDLASEWLYEKNGNLKPTDVGCGSAKQVWWKCKKCNWEWKSTIVNRKYHGCPKCSARQHGKTYTQNLVKKYGALSDMKSPFMNEWDYKKNSEMGLFPDKLTIGTNRRAWWICSLCGKEWMASIRTRSKNEVSGCPECRHYDGAQKRVDTIRTNGAETLAMTGADFLIEWDYEKNGDLTPDMFLANSGKKVWWKCSTCGNVWQAKIIYRNKKQNIGCPECSRKTNYNAKKIINIDTGEVFESAAEASRKYGIGKSSICTNLKGKTKRAGGFRWKYYDM